MHAKAHDDGGSIRIDGAPIELRSNNHARELGLAIIYQELSVVDNLTVADLGLDASQVGAAGAGQEITDVSEAEARAAGEIVVDEGDGAQRVVAFLEQRKEV